MQGNGVKEVSSVAPNRAASDLVERTVDLQALNYDLVHDDQRQEGQS